MTCKHDHIQTYRLEDGTPVMWACAECKHKFEPLVLPAADDKAGGEVAAWPDAPQTIYLQVCDDNDCAASFHSHADVTWCADKINYRDIKYVRSDARAMLAAAPKPGDAA